MRPATSMATGGRKQVKRALEEERQPPKRQRQRPPSVRRTKAAGVCCFCLDCMHSGQGTSQINVASWYTSAAVQLIPKGLQ